MRFWQIMLFFMLLDVISVAAEEISPSVSRYWKQIEEYKSEFQIDLQKIYAEIEGKIIEGEELHARTQIAERCYLQAISGPVCAILHTPNISSDDFLKAYVLYSRILNSKDYCKEELFKGLSLLEKFISSNDRSDSDRLEGIQLFKQQLVKIEDPKKCSQYIGMLIEQIDSILLKAQLPDNIFQEGIELKFELYLMDGRSDIAWAFIEELEKSNKAHLARAVWTGYLSLEFYHSYHRYQGSASYVESKIEMYKDDIPYEVACLAVDMLRFDVESKDFDQRMRNFRQWILKSSDSQNKELLKDLEEIQNFHDQLKNQQLIDEFLDKNKKCY